MSRKRKEKKQEEQLEALGLLYWVLSSDLRTGIVCEEIEKVGNFYQETFKALMGNPPTETTTKSD